MRNLILLVIPILLSCSSPTSSHNQTPVPNKEVDRTVLSAPQRGISEGATKTYDFDFSQAKINYQPPAPPYPATAKQNHIDGTVVVELTINPKGEVTEAKALSGPLELREYAASWARQWRFTPAILGGVPQYARFKLKMPFRLK